jgi:DNA-binding transcriptional LysR family regulator
MSDIDLMKISQLDGSLLLVLRELLRQRRSTMVARRLGLSQSAISHALARLRVLFDDPLFTRRPHGLEPTRRALELAPRIDALLSALHDVLGTVSRFSAATSTRSFRIGAPDHVTTLVAPALVERFGALATQARLEFSQRLGPDALDAVLRDDLDLALGRFGVRDERLVSEALFDDTYCLIARRDHKQLKRHKLNAARYAQLDHVRVSVSSDFRAPSLGLSDAALHARTIATVPRFAIAFEVVARSQAVALAPSRLARRHAAAFNLRLHTLPFALEPIHVVAVRRPQPDAGVAFLLETLKRVVADTA